MSVPFILKIGRERFDEKDITNTYVEFTKYKEENDFVNDIKNKPHAYVLACLMDKQIKAERAWAIPYKISKLLGTFEIDELATKSEEDYIKIFEDNKLHRFNKSNAKTFRRAVNDIKNKYNGNASLIWEGKPSSASVVYKFLSFYGCGIKIATMAANILVRQFKIPFSDYCSIDISPDVHLIRVMKRMGLVPNNAKPEMIIYKAREINPEFPGIIDFSCWEIGKYYCHPTNPNCGECPVTDECKKII